MGLYGVCLLAYAAFEVPSGWLGDVFGPRSTLIRIVLWWSAFTALTGCVGFNLGSATLGIWFLVLIRFLFGMGEAGAYPNITRALHNWFPFKERGFTQGFVWMSGRLMGGLTPLIWAGLVTSVGGREPLMSWRGAFLAVWNPWAGLVHLIHFVVPQSTRRKGIGERCRTELDSSGAGC